MRPNDLGETRPSSPDFATLEGALGHRFSIPGLLTQALTHRSAGLNHYERLEFLGDAILDGVIAVALYRQFPNANEGELSRYRASLVRQDSLLRVAETLGLAQFLALGEGERLNGGATRPSILADCVEALVGAVYLDGGPLLAEECVMRLFASGLEGLQPGSEVKDAKTQLQEILQGRRLPLPRYTVLNVDGQAHAQEFEVECRTSMGVRMTGRGTTRRGAEQAAASKVVAVLQEREFVGGSRAAT